MSREIGDYMIDYMILAKKILKKCANNFSQRVDNYFKRKTVIYKGYI